MKNPHSPGCHLTRIQYINPLDVQLLCQKSLASSTILFFSLLFLELMNPSLIQSRNAFAPVARTYGRVSQMRQFSFIPSKGKERVVILGSGWGGYNVLRGIDKKKWGELGIPRVYC